MRALAEQLAAHEEDQGEALFDVLNEMDSENADSLLEVEHEDDDESDFADEEDDFPLHAYSDEVAEKARQHFSSVEDDETRIAWIVEPERARVPGLPAFHLDRTPLSRMWAPDFAQKNWPELSRRLWERFELQLQSFRGKARGQVAELDARFAVHLSDKAQNEWHKEQRSQQKWDIERDLGDIFDFLFFHDGFPTAERALALATRPGCKQPRKLLEQQILNSLATPKQREPFELGAEWDEFLANCEKSLDSIRPNEPWERQHREQGLATAFYRRGNLAKFQLYAAREGALPSVLLDWCFERGDLETWTWLQRFLDSTWGFWNLSNQWQTLHAQNPELWPRLLDIAVSSSNDNAAKTALDNLAALPALDFAPHAETIARGLESPLSRVKRWTMTTLLKLDTPDFDVARAIGAASESLWSEVGALAIGAAKFLAFCAQTSPEHAPEAWSHLEEALPLENFAVLEAIGRALAKIKRLHPELELSPPARARLGLLAEMSTERFGKWKL